MSPTLTEPARVLIVDDDESDITLIIDALAARRLPSDPHVVHDAGRAESSSAACGPGRSRPRIPGVS